MKSFCIKTNNNKIIEYLLNKIENLDFPNIYYCRKSFKIYENVILHYREKNEEKFDNIISDIITDTIFIFYQENILKRIININYFYFEQFEKNKIYENSIDLFKQYKQEIKENLFKQVNN